MNMNQETEPLKKPNNRMFAADILEAPKWNLHRWAALPLRLIVGYGFMEHGYAKLIHGPERFAGILHALAVPAPELMAWATIMVELLGGLAVLLGAFIPLASVPMACVLLTAMFTAHLQYGFQRDQNSGRNGRRRSIRPTRLRSGPLIPGLSCRPHFNR